MIIFFSHPWFWFLCVRLPQRLSIEAIMKLHKNWSFGHSTIINFGNVTNNNNCLAINMDVITSWSWLQLYSLQLWYPLHSDDVTPLIDYWQSIVRFHLQFYKLQLNITWLHHDLILITYASHLHPITCWLILSHPSYGSLGKKISSLTSGHYDISWYITGHQEPMI